MAGSSQGSAGGRMLGAIIATLALARPIYRNTATYGHFGRAQFPWEQTDRADAIRQAVA